MCRARFLIPTAVSWDMEGYYDRFLTQDAPQARRIGLAYSLQMVEQVPMEAHDQYMDILITEQQIYDCRNLREGM